MKLVTSLFGFMALIVRLQELVIVSHRSELEKEAKSASPTFSQAIAMSGTLPHSSDVMKPKSLMYSVRGCEHGEMQLFKTDVAYFCIANTHSLQHIFQIDCSRH